MLLYRWVYGNSPLSSLDTCNSCSPGCSKCDSASSCSECFDKNTEIINFNCHCKLGFYGNRPLSSTDKCIQGCSECSLKLLVLSVLIKTQK